MKYDFEKERKRSRTQKVIFYIARWIVEITLVIGLAYAVINFAMERTTMLGDSMEITLQANDKILINKMAYYFKEPKRFDVIVFKQSGKEHSYYNTKRIIGLPGEKVKIQNGNVYINGTLLVEPMEVEEMQISGLAEEEFILEEDEFFVLGDKRNNSEDSRFANIAMVVKSDIIGKAWIRLSPFSFVNKINVYVNTQEE